MRLLPLAATLLFLNPRPCPRPASSPSASDDAAYERWRRPDLLLAFLAPRAGDRAADIGAGSGLLTAHLARAVGPRGRVVATDIDRAQLARLTARALSLDATAAPIVSRLVAPADPGLEPRAYDLILLSEVDHLLPDRFAYFTRIRSSLAPSGRVAITNRMLYRAPALDAAARAGLRVAREDDRLLPGHYVAILEVAK